MPNWRWYESQSKTNGAYRRFKTKQKQGKTQTTPHHGDTGITGDRWENVLIVTTLASTSYTSD